MPRAIWKGSISFGLVHIPISLYSAENSAADIDFTMLDKRDMAPVGYRRINKKTGKDVEWENIVKGYEYSDAQYVVLGEEDFKRANVEATQTIDITDFVDASEIPAFYFEKPYFLEPVKKGEKSYALLRETLKRTGKVGIASVVIHTRQHLAALIPNDKVLVLNLMRFANELRDPSDLKLPAADAATPKEIEIAEQLVNSMAGEWEPEKYHDSYHEDLLELIDNKVKAGDTETVSEPVAPQKTADVIDLMALLKRSVEETGNKRKATPSKKPTTSSEKSASRPRKRA